MSKIKSSYDPEKTGARIQKCRKEIAKSQTDFLELTRGKLKASRSSLSKWENGDGDFSVWQLLELCNIFGCDPGYLLGEYDEKTGIVADIRQEIGLTEDTILSLKEITREAPVVKNAVYTFLDDLLDNIEFLNLAIAYKRYREHSSESAKLYVLQDEDGKAVEYFDEEIFLNVVQNRFIHIVTREASNRDPLSRSAHRKYWNGLTDEEKADIIAQAELDIEQGK